MPEDIPAGRAFRAGSGIETQVALLAPDASGPGQAAALREIAAEAAAGTPPSPRRSGRSGSMCCRPGCPSTRRGSFATRRRGRCGALVGVGGDDLAAYGADLADGLPAFIVGGPAKSGRSTVLATMARSFLTAGTQVVLVTPRPSPLRALATEPGVLRLFEGTELDRARRWRRRLSRPAARPW